MRLGFLPLFTQDNRQNNYFGANGIASIAACLAQAGLEDVFIAQDLRALMARNPTMVGISSPTTCFRQVQPVAEIIKQQLGVPIILGGAHISNLPLSLPPDVDLALIGEAELSMTELMKVFIKDPQPNPMKYGRIPGIIYQSRGRVYQGPPPKPIQHIDRLPLPKRSLFAKLKGFWMPSVLTSRGLRQMGMPYSAAEGAKPRFHSPERVVQEISQIAREYKKRYPNMPVMASFCPVVIADELFTSPMPRFEKLVQLIRQEKLHEMVFFAGALYVKDLTQEVCLLLKDMNMPRLSLHLEAPSRQGATSRNARALELCRKHNIQATASFHLADRPDQSRGDIARTFWFIRDHARELLSAAMTYVPPFPGTELWNVYLKQNKLDPRKLPEIPWETFDFQYFPNSPFVNGQMTQAEFGPIYKACQELCATIIPDPKIHAFTGEQIQQAMTRTFQQLETLFPPGTQDILDIWNQEKSTDFSAVAASRGYRFHRLSFSNGRIAGRPERPCQVILMYYSLELSSNPLQDLERLKSFLAPGGRLVLILINAQSVGFLLNVLHWLYDRAVETPTLKYYSAQTIGPLLETAGLTIQEQTYNIINLIPYQSFLEGFIPLMTKVGNLPVPLEQMGILDLIITADRKEDYVRSVSQADAGKDKDLSQART